jgi:two-component system, chemotaxis family, protein-glutamate methylesterase/glutaminase
MIRVLLVDDSAIVRAMVRQVMENDVRFKIVGEASNGENAVECNSQLNPDLVIMDINMPIMDGIEATKQILTNSNPAVIIFTTEDNAVTGYRCIEAGALEVISKPDLSVMNPGMMKLFCDRIAALGEKHYFTVAGRVAGAARSPGLTKYMVQEAASGSKDSGAEAGEDSKSVLQNIPEEHPYLNTVLPQLPGEYHILLAGASTGGPAALRQLLTGLGSDFPLPVLITQHIDSSFDTHFAGWLTESTGMSVEIAKEGTVPLQGHVYIAPADRHLVVQAFSENINGCILGLNDDPPVHFLRPAVDKLFFSAVDVFHNHILAVILTGMGRDGADGCKRIVEAGGYTVAESESTCAVFGMPRAAIECGGASATVPLGQIAGFLRDRAGVKKYG